MNLDDKGIIPFLNQILDLKSMPSEDSRFNDAESDIIQHTINNDDWSLYELFFNRLKLFENNDNFIKFLEVFLSPEYQDNADIVFNISNKINDILFDDKLILGTVSYKNDFPILEVIKDEITERPVNIPINKIPFFVLPYPNGYINKFIERISIDKKRPSNHFILVADNWDDYQHKTTFWLYYVDNGNKSLQGIVKIGNSTTINTIDSLQDKFFSLDKDFVSLGQSKEYYKSLNKLFGKMMMSVLYSLRDAAFFSDISEEHEISTVFKKSLIRDDRAERLYRIAKPMIQGADLKNLYSFKYEFSPKYADSPISVPFLFSTDGLLPRRMIALIGKNGAGKTQLLTTLPVDMADENSESFTPQKPVYSKVIAVSYSTFDNFHFPKKNVRF
ncbi:hypothetical protein [Photobacterium kishitanii]|uniref:AbiJ-related protein n=1 Tax=Photobacterium kishitanii TaxID=318456 RepID=UPI002E115FF5